MISPSTTSTQLRWFGGGMSELRLLTATQQVAAYLREELVSGRWAGRIPGGDRLATELGVGRNTVEGALKELEAEGLLIPQGAGRRRKVMIQERSSKAALRVVFLTYDETDRKLDYLLDLQFRLIEAGHSASFASRTLLDLGLDAKRVARLVSETRADAWVVFSGPRAVLEWFADQSVPTFAAFGRRRTVRIAGSGPDKLPVLLEVVRGLVARGHRRLVMLMREEHRIPQPSILARAFLAELELLGLPTGSYNLPDWEDNADGFLRCIDSLFQVTPPTALIIDEVSLFVVAQQHLARRGILAPEHVSLVCNDPDPTFDWFRPTVAHIHWDSQPVVRRVLRWVENVSRGKNDCRQTFTKAEFVVGGTIGQVKNK